MKIEQELSCRSVCNLRYCFLQDKGVECIYVYAYIAAARYRVITRGRLGLLPI